MLRNSFFELLCRDTTKSAKYKTKRKSVTFPGVYTRKSTKDNRIKACGLPVTQNREDCCSDPRAVYEIRKRCKRFIQTKG
jgi:hypothetical protein